MPVISADAASKMMELAVRGRFALPEFVWYLFRSSGAYTRPGGMRVLLSEREVVEYVLLVALVKCHLVI